MTVPLRHNPIVDFGRESRCRRFVKGSVWSYKAMFKLSDSSTGTAMFNILMLII
jgi:hypothetical protein